MKNLGYYNGSYASLEDMSIPITDRSITFGDAIYDSIYSRNYIPYCIDEHIDRFYQSAELININLPYTKAFLKDTILDLVKKIDSDEMLIYWQASRGCQVREHVYADGLKANLMIILTPKRMYDKDKKLSLISMSDLRHSYCNIKSTDLLHNVICSTYASRNKYDEVVFVRNKFVTECSHSNISFIKNGVFTTAPTDRYILNGIARQHLIDKCKLFGIKVEERHFTLAEMMQADEIINSSAGSLCTRVDSIDNLAVGGKDIISFTKLQNAVFDDFITGTTVNG